jgi:hypothetical protein
LDGSSEKAQRAVCVGKIEVCQRQNTIEHRNSTVFCGQLWALFLLNRGLMSAIPAVYFLFAALGCSFIGRALLVRAAFGVNFGWGMTVLLIPFGPLFFRFSYRELAYPTRYWRMATGPLLLLFFLNGGSASSIESLTHFGKPSTVEASAGDTHFHLPVPSQVVAEAFKEAKVHKEDADAPSAASSANTAPAAPTATPSKAVAAAAAMMAMAPKVLNPAERKEANRKEFERLAEWYENLKRERGYLRKGDTAAVEAYNAEAAKYQAALQLAKTEEAELAKLTAKK